MLIAITTVFLLQFHCILMSDIKSYRITRYYSQLVSFQSINPILDCGPAMYLQSWIIFKVDFKSDSNVIYISRSYSCCHFVTLRSNKFTIPISIPRYIYTTGIILSSA